MSEGMTGARRPLKVAMIVGGFPKITETFILNQITGLLDAGHEVDIYARRRLAETAVHEDVERYGLRARTCYYELPHSRLGRLRHALRSWIRHGLKHPYALARCMALWRYGSLYAVLNNLAHAGPFLERRYDIVMCHYGTNGIDFIFLKDLFPDLRFVTMFHGGDLLLGDEKGAHVYARLRAKGDVFLVTSDVYGRRKLLEMGFDASRIVRHRVGVAVDRIGFKTRTKPTDELRLLSVARLVPEKGLEYGIRAVATFRQAHPELPVRYRVIGDGPQRDALVALSHRLGVQDEVQFLGTIPSQQVIEWMHASDVFLLPSVAEPFGVVLLEAQASGMPVVATRAGGVPEAVLDGEAGLLVPARDPGAIVTALEFLLARADDWERMGHAGRRWAAREFDITALNSRLLGLFDGLLVGDRAGDDECAAA